MQVFTSSNTATPDAIVDAVVNAFNARSAVQTKQLSTMDKGRLLTNYALYTDVAPYSVFYRVGVAIAASVNKEQAQSLFKLSDAKIDALTKRVKTSLETGHGETWSAFNDIERAIKKMAYTIPELAQTKTAPTQTEPKATVRTYHPSFVEPLVLRDPSPVKKTESFPVARPKAISEPARKVSRAQQIEADAQPAKDLAKAAAPEQENKKPAVRKKREELTLSKDITGLTLATIATKLHKLYDDVGMGHVSKEELSNVKFATEHALRLRGLIAYTAYRALPSANHNLDRISSAAFLTRMSVPNILAVVEKKVEKSDADTIKFLRAAGNELGLSDHQKALLLDPKEPRFKTWLELQSLIAPKGQTSLQSPEGP